MNKLLLLIFVLFLVGCTVLQQKPPAIEKGTSSGELAEEMQEAVLINLQDGTFDKPKVTIKKGTKVTWKNLDDKPYWFTVYVYVLDEKGKQIERYPSDALNLNDEFSLVFEQVGEHDIKGHEYGSLVGKIIVID